MAKYFLTYLLTYVYVLVWGYVPQETDLQGPRGLGSSSPQLPPEVAPPFCFVVQGSPPTVSWSTSFSSSLRVPFGSLLIGGCF